MKQDINPVSGSSGKTTLPAQTTPSEKPAKNLYDPYVTPYFAYALLRLFARLVFFLTMRVHLRGRYNVPRRGPYIIAANHLSWLDIPLVPAYIPSKVIYMSKDEVFHSKVGWLARFLGAFPVKRGEADRQAIRTANEQLKKGNVLVIFPEGTRSKTQTLAKGYDGLGMIALRSGVPIIPVAVWGSEKGLKKIGAPVTISYGKPIILKPKGPKTTREDIEAATDEVMRQIASMLPVRYRGVYTAAVQQQESAPQP